MLGFNIEALAKTELAKVEAKLKAIDADHNGLGDLAEAQKLIGEGVAELQALEAEFTPAEVVAAINVLFPGKLTAAEVTAAEGSGAKLISGFTKLATVAKLAETVL